MSRVISIINQLQDRLAQEIDVDLDEGSLSGGPEFVNQYPGYDDEDDVDVADVGQIATPYVTNRPFILPPGGDGKSLAKHKLSIYKKIKEQDEDELTKPPAGTEGGEDLGADVGANPEAGGDIGADAGMGDIGTDAGMGGMGAGFGQQEEPLKASEVGRVYELKKIYSRLTSIESYLGNESASELLELRNYVSQAIELFEVISANFPSFKDQLDEIIVTYYKFITKVYTEVKDFFQKESKAKG